MGKNNMQRLGDTLDTAMKRRSAAAVPQGAALGTINGDLSLTVDGIDGKIPKSEYMISITLSHNNYRTSVESHSHDGGNHGGHLSGSGSHTHGGGDHDHRLPSVFRGLKAGDRVLVVFVGNEPVITDIVVSGDKVNKN